jgi:hypothetical protein
MAPVTSVVQYTLPSSGKTYSVAVIHRNRLTVPKKSTEFWRMSHDYQSGKVEEGELDIAIDDVGSCLLTGNKPDSSFWGRVEGHQSYEEAQQTLPDLASKHFCQSTA